MTTKTCVCAVCREHQFTDKYLFYRFTEDDQGVGVAPSQAQRKEAEEELADALRNLAQIGPDAMMRLILRKPSVTHLYIYIHIHIYVFSLSMVRLSLTED